MEMAMEPVHRNLQVIVRDLFFSHLNNKFGHKINSYISACRNYVVNRYNAAIGINRPSFA